MVLYVRFGSKADFRFKRRTAQLALRRPARHASQRVCWPGANFLASPGLVCRWPGANFFAWPGSVCRCPGAYFFAELLSATCGTTVNPTIAVRSTNRLIIVIGRRMYPPRIRSVNSYAADNAPRPSMFPAWHRSCSLNGDSLSPHWRPTSGVLY